MKTIEYRNLILRVTSGNKEVKYIKAITRLLKAFSLCSQITTNQYCSILVNGKILENSELQTHQDSK